MAENSDNAMARKLTDAIGRAIAETLNAGEVNKSLKSNQMPQWNRGSPSATYFTPLKCVQIFVRQTKIYKI